MPTITTVDATWDTGTTMDAAELRRADTAMFLGDGAVNGVRGGIVQHGGNSLAVAVNGSDQVSVQAGAFVVPAATGLGAYRGSLAATTSNVNLSARNATNPRIDLVVVEVGTGSVATVKTIDGTPSASPSAPALPAQHIELARLTVPQTGGGAVTVSNAFRAYATGLGGTLYVESLARLPGSGNQKGQRAVALDTGLEHIWNGSAWTQTGWQTYTPVWSATGGGTSIGNGSVSGRFARLGGNDMRFYIALFIGSTTSLGSGRWEFTLPNTPIAYSDGFTTLGRALARDTGTRNYGLDVIYTAPQKVHCWRDAGATEATATPTTPFAWANGDCLIMLGNYEAA